MSQTHAADDLGEHAVPELAVPEQALLGHDETLLWPSRRPDQDSSWHGHVSFAHWLIAAARPGIVVELGTQNGVSFAAFCNAMHRCAVGGKCFAVDTWAGDSHTGAYEEGIFASIDKFARENFPDQAVLLRCYFDEALRHFADGSIDLLHIDGLHTYEAVRHDFETWLPKLSDRAIVLFHDTEIHTGDFGVWRFWEEITAHHPSFSFHHSAGLGVLAVGSHVAPAVLALCRQNSGPQAGGVQAAFEAASAAAQEHGQDELSRWLQAQRVGIFTQGKNIALGATAMQSSGFMNAPPTPGGAVDGVKSGLFGFHTNMEQNPWWMVDLGQARKIHEIVVFNRIDGPCAFRARLLSVLVSLDGETWQTFYVHDGSVFGGIDGNPLRIPGGSVEARFVRLKLRERQMLHLDEVEIYALDESVTAGG